MTSATLDIDPKALRDCCGRFATGVTVVTTRTPEGDHGMTISAFMSVSLEPPLVCISVGRRARMLPKLRASGRYAVNILTEDMRAHALHFAGRPDASLSDLFEDRHSLPVLRGAAAVLVTEVTETVEAGDHVLLIGEVRHLEHEPVARPLLHHAGQFGGISGHAA
ncbi:flavin reductase [Thioclava sp. NG1]|uniref:flavin reductase family protein n=1 Tax=unclassified Thioclava TaxID=2621713 RepID=UPI000B53DC6F|nr:MULTISPECIES: flavin reductase family protein [unclassified Thioclava]OWY10306.1 phenol hydroxylase [Thioclava sp. F34-6]PWE48350.1 flavin reductase [Thioclava sp. NG1]